MTTVSAFAPFEYFFFPGFMTSSEPRKPDPKPVKRVPSREDALPDLLIHGTRSVLLRTTTSLTKLSSFSHQYFTRMCQVFAFERMMRDFIRFTTAMSPFTMNFAPVNFWSSIMTGGGQTTQHWAKPMLPHSAPPSLPLLPSSFRQYPTPLSLTAWPEYAAFMAVLAATPSMDAVWDLFV